MLISRRADRGRSQWRALLVRRAHEREQIVASSQNPIIVPRAEEVRRAVWDFFEAAHRYELTEHGYQSRLADPDWHGDPAEEERTHLDPARTAAETAAIRLIEALAEGGRPPWRWTLQRWTRRASYVRWYLGEQQWRPERRRHRGPWATAPITGAAVPRCLFSDEPPF